MDDQPPAIPNLTTRFAPWLLIAVGALIYANSLSSSFIYDDFGAIVDNPDIRQLWPPRWAMPTSGPHAPTNSRPVVSFSLALNYALGGLNPTGYHLLNIAVHILCSLALFGVVRRTLFAPVLAERFCQIAGGMALTCAFLWLVHPLNTQCVDYTIQRSESLMALFYLLTLYCAIRLIKSGERLWLITAVLACAAGMASKEVMVTAPLLVLLYDRTFHAGSFAAAWRQRKGLYAGLAATYLLLAFLMVTAPHGRSIGLATAVTPWNYLLNQCLVIIDYLQKAFWPHPLIIDYGLPRLLSIGEVLPGAITLLTLLVLTAIALYRRSALGFLGAWFFAILGPTSSLIPIVNEVGAERRAYLPLAALVVLAVCAGYLLLQRVAPGRRWTGAAVAAGLSVALGWGTIQRNLDYRHPLNLWQSAVDAVPHNPRAHTYLGLNLKAKGEISRAVRHYRRALELDPDYPQAHSNLGIVLAEQGEPETAIRHFRHALKGLPNLAEIHNNLGNALLTGGELDEAEQHFHRAIEIRPHYAEAYSNLGIAAAMQGRIDAAVRHFRKALELDPDYPRGHYNLGITFLNANKADEAVRHFRKALELDSDFTAARRSLDAALALQKRDLKR